MGKERCYGDLRFAAINQCQTAESAGGRLVGISRRQEQEREGRTADRHPMPVSWLFMLAADAIIV